MPLSIFQDYLITHDILNKHLQNNLTFSKKFCVGQLYGCVFNDRDALFVKILWDNKIITFILYEFVKLFFTNFENFPNCLLENSWTHSHRYLCFLRDLKAPFRGATWSLCTVVWTAYIMFQAKPFRIIESPIAYAF